MVVGGSVRRGGLLMAVLAPSCVGKMYVETGGWRLHRFLCDLVPVLLWPSCLSCVLCASGQCACLVCLCSSGHACLSFLRSLCAHAHVWYGSHCTWAVAAAARSLRRLLSRFCMRLSLGGFLVRLRTQAGHVRIFAEFGCLRRVDPSVRPSCANHSSSLLSTGLQHAQR